MSNVLNPAAAETRDLEADLAICEAATQGPWGFAQDDEFASIARTGWPHAIRRAIEAEKENVRLRNELQIYQEQERGSRSCWD